MSGLSGTRFNFLPNGDPPARYRILNFRQPTPGHYEWVDVGNFYNKELTASQILCSVVLVIDDPPIPNCLWFKLFFKTLA